MAVAPPSAIVGSWGLWMTKLAPINVPVGSEQADFVLGLAERLSVMEDELEGAQGSERAALAASMEELRRVVRRHVF